MSKHTKKTLSKKTHNNPSCGTDNVSGSVTAEKPRVGVWDEQPKDQGDLLATCAAEKALSCTSGSGKKTHFNQSGITAKKAESAIAEGTGSSHSNVGQAQSVPVSDKKVEAPHLEVDSFNTKPEKCEEQSEDFCQSTPKASGKSDESKKKEEKSKKSEKVSDEMASNEKAPYQKNSDKKAQADDENAHTLNLNLDLGTAAGLALLAVDQATKVVHDAAKNWEEKVDAVAQKAHETIESAQKAIKNPVGETLKKVDDLRHREAS